MTSWLNTSLNEKLDRMKDAGRATDWSMQSVDVARKTRRIRVSSDEQVESRAVMNAAERVLDQGEVSKSLFQWRRLEVY